MILKIYYFPQHDLLQYMQAYKGSSIDIAHFAGLYDKLFVEGQGRPDYDYIFYGKSEICTVHYVQTFWEM